MGADNHMTVVPENHAERNLTERVSRGYIQFDELTETEFIDLVIQTLEQSEFIETEWKPNPTGGEDSLVIHERY